MRPPRERSLPLLDLILKWDEFYMAPSATTIDENGKHWQYALPRRVVQGSSTLLVLRARG
jgi:hypothetical protein